jgi:hypothetical protein
MNLLEEAESLMLHQFKNSPKLIGLIRCLVKPFQDVLDQIEELDNGNYINKAYGQRLDILGNVVGQPRRDLNDEDYRAWIKVGIRLNIGAGTPEDILAILAILYKGKPDLLMQEYFPNEVVFTLFALPQAPLKAFFNIIQSAVPVTTLCHFIKADALPVFRFDVGKFSIGHFADFYQEDL